MFAKRIGDESLGVTPRLRDVPSVAVAVGERLPLLHKEGGESGGRWRDGGRSRLGNGVVFGVRLFLIGPTQHPPFPSLISRSRMGDNTDS